VIEHIEPKKVKDYLSEIKRVLKDGGVFVASTPNKKIKAVTIPKTLEP
jgi:2-polyprenyl-3-methyl-5-hydroxy-6-metoxy-1,4-benzoquinol methylase